MAGLEYVACDIQTGLGHLRLLFSATPYEGGAAQNNQIYTYISNPRRDMVWLGSQTTGNGWEHNFELRGKQFRRDTVFGGRASGVQIYEYRNTNVTGGFLPLGFSTDSEVLFGIIKDDGGVNTDFLRPGVEKNSVVAATPDWSLAKQRTPRLPYLLAAIAAKERAKQAGLHYTLAELGFIPTTGENPSLTMTTDVFAGFARYIDESSLTWSDTLSPQPANEIHFLPSLSVIYALEEYFSNHVRVNGAPIGQVFGVEIVPDGESSIINIDIAEGSPHSAVLSALREGNFRYWWDHKCMMHLVPDYCNANFGGGVYVGSLTLDKIAGITITVSPGPPVGYPRVSRVYANGVWTSPASDSDSLAQQPPLDSWKAAPNKATYPIGQQVGLGGEDVSLSGMHISHMDVFTRSEYRRLSQRQRVTISGFPFICWAIRAYNRIVRLTFPQDPLGSFKPSDNGYYSVESVSIQPGGLDEPGGNSSPEATIVFQEIITGGS